MLGNYTLFGSFFVRFRGGGVTGLCGGCRIPEMVLLFVPLSVISSEGNSCVLRLWKLFDCRLFISDFAGAIEPFGEISFRGSDIFLFLFETVIHGFPMSCSSMLTVADEGTFDSL